MSLRDVDNKDRKGNRARRGLAGCVAALVATAVFATAAPAFGAEPASGGAAAPIVDVDGTGFEPANSELRWAEKRLAAELAHISADLVAASAAWGGSGSAAYQAAMSRWSTVSADATAALRQMVAAFEAALPNGVEVSALPGAPTTTAVGPATTADLQIILSCLRAHQQEIEAVARTSQSIAGELAGHLTGPSASAALQAAARWADASSSLELTLSGTIADVEAAAAGAK